MTARQKDREAERERERERERKKEGLTFPDEEAPRQ